MTRQPAWSLFGTVVLAVLLAALPARGEAPRGTVVDPDQKPVAGAQVCYMLGGVEGICVETGKDGVYDLPISQTTTIQVKASGFQTQTVTMGKDAERIVLKRAAAMWVRVRDVATGRTVPTSEVYLVFPTGRREGPLPANDKGVKIRTLEPGRYGVLARADGYVQAKAVSVDLKPGSDEWIDVEMKPDKQREKKKR